MAYNFDEQIALILNKKFKTKVHAGYDPDDVDEFFDQTINYIKQVRELEKNYNTQLENLKKELTKANTSIENQQKMLNTIQSENDELKKEGYGNNVLSKKITDLEIRFAKQASSNKDSNESNKNK